MTEKRAPNIGARIRALREEQRHSLRSLAELCGLSFNAISRIERGELPYRFDAAPAGDGARGARHRLLRRGDRGDRDFYRQRRGPALRSTASKCRAWAASSQANSSSPSG